MKMAVRNKRGVSMIWVLCLLVVVFIIGGSILSAAAMSSGVAARYRAAKTCYYYTNTLSDVLKREITDYFEVDTNDPWYMLAQGVYNAKSTGNNATVENVELSTSFSGIENSKEPKTQMGITLKNQGVSITTHYNNEDEEAIQVEEATVKFDMTIALRTTYQGHDYVVYLKYKFSGKAKGTVSGEGTGIITEGTYTYKGAFDAP